MTEQEIAHLRALIEKATPTPWGMIEPIEGIGYIDMAEHRPNNGMLATCYNSVDDAALIVATVNNISAMLDEVERFQSGMMREARRVAELLNENRDLKNELSAAKRRTRQLYGTLEGARRIASEYYAFGLTGFAGEYTQMVNQLKDEPDWESE